MRKLILYIFCCSTAILENSNLIYCKGHSYLIQVRDHTPSRELAPCPDTTLFSVLSGYGKKVPENSGVSRELETDEWMCSYLENQQCEAASLESRVKNKHWNWKRSEAFLTFDLRLLQNSFPLQMMSAGISVAGGCKNASRVLELLMWEQDPLKVQCVKCDSTFGI